MDRMQRWDTKLIYKNPDFQIKLVDMYHQRDKFYTLTHIPAWKSIALKFCTVYQNELHFVRFCLFIISFSQLENFSGAISKTSNFAQIMDVFWENCLSVLTEQVRDILRDMLVKCCFVAFCWFARKIKPPTLADSLWIFWPSSVKSLEAKAISF